jgi:hypothetical protein
VSQHLPLKPLDDGFANGFRGIRTRTEGVFGVLEGYHQTPKR